MCEKARSNASKYGFLTVLDDATTPMYPDPLVSAVADPGPTLSKPGLAMPPPQPSPAVVTAAQQISPATAHLPPAFATPFQTSHVAMPPPLFPAANQLFPSYLRPFDVTVDDGLEEFGEPDPAPATSAAPPAAAAAVPSKPTDDYEKQRAANVARNDAVLAGLGLGGSSSGDHVGGKRKRPGKLKARDDSRDSRELRARTVPSACS
jgi:hypothetical protein